MLICASRHSEWQISSKYLQIWANIKQNIGNIRQIFTKTKWLYIIVICASSSRSDWLILANIGKYWQLSDKYWHKHTNIDKDKRDLYNILGVWYIIGCSSVPPPANQTDKYWLGRLCWHKATFNSSTLTSLGQKNRTLHQTFHEKFLFETLAHCFIPTQTALQMTSVVA